MTPRKNVKRPLWLLVAAVVIAGSVGVHYQAQASPDFTVKVRGMSVFDEWQGAYESSEMLGLVDLMEEDYGVDWISIIVTWYQDTVHSTEMHFLEPGVHPWMGTQTDAEIIGLIEYAHSKGMSVMLKPHVNSRDDSFRGRIGEEFSEAEWASWFASYRDFINRYAQLAEDGDVELFCVGTELSNTALREQDWREVVAGVRQRYSGPLTYAANHSGEEVEIQWWDAVDYIGVDGYYPLTDKNDPSVAELKTAWQPHLETLENLSSEWAKPVIFTEIGYVSLNGTNRDPWREGFTSTIDNQEQADCYQAALETFWEESWFGGMFWWSTMTSDADFSSSWHIEGFNPFGKPAGQVMREWYGSPAATATPTVPPTDRPTAVPTSTSLPTNTPTVLPTDTPIPEPTSTFAPDQNELVVDDTDSGFSTGASGDHWQEYVGAGGQHYGNTHHYNHETGTGQDIATWSFTVPESGSYEVFAWWWQGSWRPTDVPYTVHHLNGATTSRVNQRVDGGQWNLLGTFDFQGTGSVVVSDDVSSGRDIVADAVRLVRVDPMPTATPDGSSIIYLPIVAQRLQDFASH